MTSFDRLYELRGKEIERDISRRNGIVQALRRFAKKRENQTRANAKLERELVHLLKQAREIVPPISTYELERLSGVPRSNIQRLISKGAE